MDDFENESNQSVEKLRKESSVQKKPVTGDSAYIKKIKKKISTKPIIIVAVGVILIFGILEFTNINPFRMIRNLLFTEASLVSVTVTSLEDTVLEIFQVSTLQIDSRNMTYLEVVPGGFLNPGTITVILEYDSTVKFGVRDPQQIRMRRVGDVIFVDSSTIDIGITDAYVRNFERKGTFKSNPLLSWTPAVIDQVFQAQMEHERIAEQRLHNERNIESARGNFIRTFEVLSDGLGLTVVWE